MPNRDRGTCILKIDQCKLAVDKITTYLADINAVLSEDEKKFQRTHQHLKDEVFMCGEIAMQLEKALDMIRANF